MDMNYEEQALIRCDYCGCKFLENRLLYDNNGNEVCPNCGHEDCFTIIDGH